MDLENILKIIEVIVSILLVIVILLQQKEGGLGTTFGGGGGGGDGFRTKRGMELVLSRATVILLIGLALNSLAIAYI